jgi:hypothetical protein
MFLSTLRVEWFFVTFVLFRHITLFFLMKKYTFKKLLEASVILRKKIKDEPSNEKKTILSNSYLELIRILKC